jgi:DNA-binding response OmpR family regulator
MDTLTAEMRDCRRGAALIFIVEDEPDVASLIAHTLRTAGFATSIFPDGQHVVELALEHLPSLVLLDRMLPGLDGLQVLCGLEDRARGIKKIMLSARSSEPDKVHALELGADDYITKPFSPRELVARVRAVLRSSSEDAGTPQILQVGALAVDLQAMGITVEGRAVVLTMTEFKLLVYFMQRPELTLSRDRLLEALWSSSNRPIEGPRIIDVYVRRLREKIETDPSHPRRLVTRRKGGYALLKGDESPGGDAEPDVQG